MDRARQWWSHRTRWQKGLLIVLALVLVVGPFTGGEDEEPGTAAPETTSAPTTTERVATTLPPTTGVIDDTLAPTTTSSAPSTPETTTSAGSSAKPGFPPGAVDVFVVSVTDGGTVRVQFGSSGTTKPVRLIGINAPNKTSASPTRATAALEALLARDELAMTSDVPDRDQFDRLLQYLWLDE